MSQSCIMQINIITKCKIEYIGRDELMEEGATAGIDSDGGKAKTGP